MEGQIIEIDHVDSVHHTHIWSLEGQHHVYTTHVKLKAIDNTQQLINIKSEINKNIKKVLI